MIETLLHFIRLAFATSGLWTLDPSNAPTSDNWMMLDDGSALYLKASPSKMVVRCSERTKCTGSACFDVIDQCEVTP